VAWLWLGAAYVVEGSGRKSGSRIRVTSQLIDTRSGAHIWSESYDRDSGDTLTLQDQIAGSVTSALQLAVTAAEPASRRLSSCMDAYTLYLRGRVSLELRLFPRSALTDFDGTICLNQWRKRCHRNFRNRQLHLQLQGKIGPTRRSSFAVHR
jgi:hypothetical protein